MTERTLREQIASLENRAMVLGETDLVRRAEVLAILDAHTAEQSALGSLFSAPSLVLDGDHNIVHMTHFAATSGPIIQARGNREVWLIQCDVNGVPLPDCKYILPEGYYTAAHLAPDAVAEARINWRYAPDAIVEDDEMDARSGEGTE